MTAKWKIFMDFCDDQFTTLHGNWCLEDTFWIWDFQTWGTCMNFGCFAVSGRLLFHFHRGCASVDSWGWLVVLYYELVNTQLSIGWYKIWYQLVVDSWIPFFNHRFQKHQTSHMLFFCHGTCRSSRNTDVKGTNAGCFHHMLFFPPDWRTCWVGKLQGVLTNPIQSM